MAGENIQQLTLHAAWSAANERSLLWQSAARDRRGVEDAARRVADAFSTESVEAMKSLAFAAAWHCANRRRFFFSDAEKDRRSVEFYAELLERLTSRIHEELASLVKRLCWNAAWHAANTRSMMWKDAAKDIRNFQHVAAELAAFLGENDGKNGDIGGNGEDGSEGFRTPLGSSDSDGDAEEGYEGGHSRHGEVPGFGLPLGGIPRGNAGHNGYSNDNGVSSNVSRDVSRDDFRRSTHSESIISNAPNAPNASNAPNAHSSVLDEAIFGWRETSMKMHGDEICASSFVSAALGTIVVFDSFGKMLQSFQADMRKNAKMIQQHVSSDVSLQCLIDGESKKAGSYAKALVEGSAAMGLLWLMRALRLLEKTLHVVLEDAEQPLHKCIQMGYEGSLKPHHNFLTRNVIQAAIMAAPSRSIFLSKLCPDPGNPKEKIQEFLKFYSPVLQKAHTYLLTCRLET